MYSLKGKKLAKFCQNGDCNRKSTFNYQYSKGCVYCSDHKLPGMIEKHTKKHCMFKDCNTFPSYAFIGDKPKFCKEHKEEGMIGVKWKKCESTDCMKIPCFNFRGAKIGKFCFQHKEKDMINVVDKICEFKDCEIKPTFNYEEYKTGRFCSLHKLKGMINLSSKKCYILGCKGFVHYGIKGEEAISCKEHKSSVMIPFKRGLCHYKDCNTRANFGLKGENAQFCVIHKEDNMIDLKNKVCEYKDCIKRPNFNVKNSKVGKFCLEHKESDMVDVTHKTCILEDCLKRAIYGYCNETLNYCADHRTNFMFKKTKVECKEKGCKEIATFGNMEINHCEEHATNNEVCLIISKCSKCGSNEFLNKEGLCMTKCSIIKIFEENKKVERKKEKKMLEYLDDKLKDIQEEFKINDDKVIDRSCSLYRPDRSYDCFTHIVIVECDEEQHKNRSFCSKYRDLRHFEDCRMFEIQQAFGLPCLFIRWNPDSFKVREKLVRKYSIDKRLDILQKWIRQCINLTIDKEQPPSYIELFFDEYDEGNKTFTSIYEEHVL